MAAEYTVSVDVAVDPDTAWALVGDPCGVPRWYTAYVECSVAGDERRLRRADGAELVERLVERDDARRFYSYSVISGVPLRSHLASFEVVATPSGSRVLWRTRGESDDPAVDLEARLAPRQRDALGTLKAVLEASAAT